MQSKAMELAGHGLLVAAYLLLNTALNMTNRWVLGLSGFSFPILLTLAHLSFSFTALFVPVMFRKGSAVTKTSWKKQWRGLALVGTFMALNIGLNNFSLVRLPLSLNQVLRAALPVVTALVAVFVEDRRPSKHETWALILLTLGVCMTVFEGDVAGNALGLSMAVAGVLCAAAMMCTAGKMLHERLDAIQLTFYTAPVSMAVLFPFFLARELDRFKAYMADNGSMVWLMILGSSVVALAYNLTHYVLLQRTSSITVTVLGEVKIVGLLILSALILPGESNQLSLRMVLGMTTAVMGFCMYSNVKLWSRAPVEVKPKGKALPKDEEAVEQGIGAQGEGGPAAVPQRRHRSMCMHTPSGSFVSLLQQLTASGSPPASATLRTVRVPQPEAASTAVTFAVPPNLPPVRAKLPTARAASAELLGLVPDGPDTPPCSQPTSGTVLRAMEASSSGSSPFSIGRPSEEVHPPTVLKGAGQAWDYRVQRGVSPRKAVAVSSSSATW